MQESKVESQRAMQVAYLVNQYPKVSHSFIRREILALEKQGVAVLRISIRTIPASELVDPDDLAELARTRSLLSAGLSGLLLAGLRGLLRSPLSFLKTLAAGDPVWQEIRSRDLPTFHLCPGSLSAAGMAGSRRAEHVHAHFGTNSTTVAMLCHELGGPPYSFTVHGPEEFDGPQMISLPEKIARAAFVVAITSFCRSQLCRWCDYPHWAKIYIVHCGVDDKFLAREPPVIGNTCQLVSIGRLSGQKGQMLLLDAADVLAREGLKFRLVLVGDGELRPQLEATIRDRKLQDHVFLAGVASADEVRQHILDSRALCLPSFAEGLPVVIMESLALARRVISTYIAGHPELMDTGKTGWLIPAGSVEGLVEAMRNSLQASSEELTMMGLEGQRRVMQLHSVQKKGTKLKDLFSA